MSTAREAGRRYFHAAYESGEHGWHAHEPSPYVVAHLKRVRREIGTGRLLDIGCGEGRHCIAAAKLGFRAVGIDAEPLALRRARRFAAEKGVSGLSFRQADVFDLPLREGSFDAVLDYGCLHHQRKTDWPAYRASVLRVLKPRAFLLISVFSPRFRMFAAGGRNWSVARGSYRRCFTPDDIREFRAGDLELLDLEEERPRGFWHALLRRS
jgi:SAM-dependent methyltransferase